MRKGPLTRKKELEAIFNHLDQVKNDIEKIYHEEGRYLIEATEAEQNVGVNTSKTIEYLEEIAVDIEGIKSTIREIESWTI